MHHRVNKFKKPLPIASGAVAVLGLVALTIPSASASDIGVDSSAGRGQTTFCYSATTDTSNEVTVSMPKFEAADYLANTPSYSGPCAAYGTPAPLGGGTLRTYNQLDSTGKPISVGVVFPASTLTNMPTAMTDQHHCYDVNGDGVIDPMTECMGGFENPLDLNNNLLSRPDNPLKWVLVNYNPMGHGPTGIYDVPHFDFHFYIQSKAERDAIRPGPCGMVMNCDDFATATKPVPSQYMPTDYINNNVAEVAMGNHLIDQTSPEWHNTPFTKTFIYGAYDAKISFIEPMITKAYFQGLASGTNTNGCFPIKQPAAWQVPGYYPQSYCIRYRPTRNDFTVSMENYQHS